MAPKPTLSGQTYYPSLDGLRGLAILMILFVHLFSFIPVSRFGWIAVDLFFVLSGFLITNILIAQRGKKGFVRKFYIRRWIRTIPLYVVSLTIFFYVLPIIVSNPEPFGYLVKNQVWFWLQLQNFLFITRPDGNPNMLNHFWSLAVEEQFYLLVPGLFLLPLSAGRLINGCLAVFLAVETARILLWIMHIPDLSYQMLYSFTRIDGLIVGTSLSLIRSSMQQGRKLVLVIFPVVLIVISAILFFYRFAFNHPLPLTAICVYPAVAVAWGFILWKSIQPVHWLQKMLGAPILVFAGRISYGWYIIHQPLNWLLLQSNWHSLPFFTTMPGMILFALVSFLLSGLLAVASFYGFEQPLLRLKRFFI